MLSRKCNLYVVVYLLCRSMCIFSWQRPMRSAHYSLKTYTFAFSRAANLAKTVSEMSFFGVIHYD